MSVIVEELTASVSASEDLKRWKIGDYPKIGEVADIAIVLGGDGTMLNAARQLARFNVPLVGVNQGHLGFMTDIGRSDMLACVDHLLAGSFTPENRMMFSGDVMRNGELLASNLALNEVVLDKGAIGRLIEFELHIDGEFLFNLRSDGLIVSTPTGSTAYSLSANGPILHPRVGGILLVPLCPHSLTNRPILVGDESEVQIKIVRAQDCRVHFDGQITFDLRPDDVIHIRRSDYSICFLHPPGYSYFAMLREKLHWNKQPRLP